MSNKTFDGGPAFPSPGAFDGMKLREWFAGQAMKVLLNEDPFDDLNYTAIARHAYNMADAMIQGREEGWL